MAKRKYKRLHYEDRQTIEAMSKQGSSVSDIAEALGTHGWQPAAQLIEQYLLHSDELTKCADAFLLPPP